MIQYLVAASQEYVKEKRVTRTHTRQEQTHKRTHTRTERPTAQRPLNSRRRRRRSQERRYSFRRESTYATQHVEYAEQRMKYGILFIPGLFYEYIHLDYVRVPV